MADAVALASPSRAAAHSLSAAVASDVDIGRAAFLAEHGDKTVEAFLREQCRCHVRELQAAADAAVDAFRRQADDGKRELRQSVFRASSS